MNKPFPLDTANEFVGRHIGPRAADTAAMLQQLGYDSLEALGASVIPDSIKDTSVLELSAGLGEAQALARLKAIAAQNQQFASHIGQGYYGTHTPAPILRNLLENPAWYTAYTPYQPEISQGRLEALLNFQTLISDLTGMEIANASLLDEATAAAEAMTFCQRLSKNKAAKAFFASQHCHPQTLDVLRTRAEPLGIEVVVGDERELTDVSLYFGALLQYPASNGDIFDYSALVERFHDAKALVAVAADLLALCLLTPPGEFGADVALGSAQRFGVPLGFGGPHAAYFATRDTFKRDMPGRLVGLSVDRHGKPALRLAMQTREQHIRREKANSNICTSQVLLANMAGMYAVWHGPQGLRRIAQRTHRLTCLLAKALGVTGDFFDTIVAKVGADKTVALKNSVFNVRHIDAETVGISLDETTTREDVAALCALLGKSIDFDAGIADAIPDSLRRGDAILAHPVFNTHHTEHAMLRYLKSLQNKDLALDHAMIPLGSCTMKLNAAAEMMPVSWPAFGALHPFAPAEQAEGYAEMIGQLSQWLCTITGFDALCVQPNSGAQGEYAGLVSIRRYQAAQGQGHRDVCLIPKSAHGTNPATAHMAGLQVVVVDCDDSGNVDVADLKAKAEQHAAKLSCLMLTYPSTHGVFEEAVMEMCRIIHAHGGQVYMDGANLNAQVGLTSPGHIGADVSHINLHKTFAIPHGGGGPGMGPIGLKAHLAPHAPGHVFAADRVGSQGAVSAAPFGSASILPISWMYIAMMGGSGLKQATEVAILNANYVAARLKDHYPVLYTGAHGRVAHECILDIRAIKAATGIAEIDIAKRLMDYGFHAPTVSFPVAGTLMVEPTESESLHELDRFIDAMIQIRDEIRAIEEGKLDREDNPLKHAPHTANVVSASEWTRAYPRELAAFPLSSLRRQKYWPPVARVDNVYGDKNVMCACIPVDAYKEEAEA